MAKKTQKRQLETDSNVNDKVSNKGGSPNKKLKASPQKAEKKDESSVPVQENDLKIKNSPKKNNATNNPVVKAPNSTGNQEKSKKKNKNKAKKQGKPEDSVDNTTPLDSKNENPKISKRQEHFKEKRAEHKKQLKLLGTKPKPAEAIAKLTEEELKTKIADIESRDAKTKTAIRRLRILKKKLQVLEAGGSSQTEGTSEDLPKENKKNKLQNKSNVKTDNGEQKKKQKVKPAAKNVEQNLFIVDRVGDIAQDSSNESDEEENGLSNEKLKKNIANKSNIQKNNENEDDSEDDEDNEEPENDSEEEANEADETTNESDEEENNEDSNEDENPIKKVKIEKAATDTKTKKAQDNADKNPQQKSPAQPKKQRYVLFVGNIAYDATTVDVKKHFLTKVEKVTDVRIPLDGATKRPRGFAYVEVENSEDYEKALSLHQTFINGRQIKVEYTASGSKNASRNPDVIHKNKKLHALRNEGKLAGSQKFTQKRSFRRNFNNNPNNGPNRGPGGPNRGPGGPNRGPGGFNRGPGGPNRGPGGPNRGPGGPNRGPGGPGGRRSS